MAEAPDRLSTPAGEATELGAKPTWRDLAEAVWKVAGLVVFGIEPGAADDGLC